MIPTQTYLMPVAASSYEGSAYEGTAMGYGGIDKETIPAITNPLDYAYATQTPEEYEELINKGVSKNDLHQFGLTYLRESPKQLTGTITYTIKERDNTTTTWESITEPTEKTATFSMAAPGEFMRNHSWIIYIYFMDEKLHVLTVTNLGLRDWTTGHSQDPRSVHNW